MSSYFLGIDYGTGGCKACIIDSQANVLSYAYREYEILTNKEGFSEHRADEYWPATCSMIKECIQKAKIDSKDICGVGTSSAMPSMVMVDCNGRLINNAYNLMDRRANAQQKQVEKLIGTKAVFDISANRLEDHPLLIKLMWEKQNRPQDYEKIYKALTIDGYIRMKLTDKFTAHYSAGIFYGVAYDILKGEYKTEILEKIGISADKLPKFYRCEDIIGYVTKAAAAECGLAEGTPVAGGQVDCNAGWIGAGATEIGDIQMNLGTCGNFGVINKSTDFLYDMFTIPYTLNCLNTYVTVSTTQTGGQSLRYIKENYAQLETAAAKLLPDFDSYDLLNIEAAPIPAGSEGLIVLPYLLGERTPIWDNDARGVVFGLSLHHTKAHFVKAMMEGVAFAMYDSFRQFQDKNIPMNFPLVMNEGGAKSKLWRSIIADVLDVPTVLVQNRVGAPYGDALLAAVAVGAFPDFSIAKRKAVYVDRIEPNKKNHEKYMDYFQLFKRVYEHTKEDFKLLSVLREEK